MEISLDSLQARTMKTSTALWRRPIVCRYLLIALLAEIGYATLNISTMPVYLKHDRHFAESYIGLVLTAFLLR